MSFNTTILYIPSDILNLTFIANDSTVYNDTTYEIDHSNNWVYTIGVPLLILFGLISMVVNLRVLVSVRWIRRPLSTTLYISLSLAAADAFTSALLCINLVINSYLPVVWSVRLHHCYNLTVEALRLGGIVTTVLHLTILACNHYLGIVKPLHYPIIMTHRKTTICLMALWIVPLTFFVIYFIFPYEDCDYTFITYLDFRLMFISLLLVPLLIMTFIYAHILIIVRKQQKSWQRNAERGTSCRHRGGTNLMHDSQDQKEKSRRKRENRKDLSHHGNHDNQQPQQQRLANHHTVGSEYRRTHTQMQKNVKAVQTTLLILGSFAVGLLPAITVFLLCCPHCLFASVPTEVFWLVNVLIFTKTLANPIIYAARMHEIKEATRRMRADLCKSRIFNICSCLPLCICCLTNPDGQQFTCNKCCCRKQWQHTNNLDEVTDSQQLYNSGGSWKYGGTRTLVCRFVNNGNTPPHLVVGGQHHGEDEQRTSGRKRDENTSTVL